MDSLTLAKLTGENASTHTHTHFLKKTCPALPGRVMTRRDLFLTITCVFVGKKGRVAHFLY